MEKTLKGISVVVILVSVLFVTSIALPNLLFPKVQPTIHFEEVDKGGYSGIGSRINYVIDELDMWETLWTDIHNTSTSTPELPFVNFTEEVVIAVLLGEYATGGYIATITRINPTLTGYAIHIREEHPGPSCIVTMSITRPYHIVKAAINPSLSVDFVYDVVIRNCP